MSPNTAKLVGALTALACCNIAFGLIVQVIPLAMERKGHSASLIGWNTSAGQFGKGQFEFPLTVNCCH
jgi:hypothetical protein